jgi:hypothetical protein
LFVQKDAETSDDLLALDYQGEELRAIVGALLGIEFEGDGDEQPGRRPVSSTITASTARERNSNVGKKPRRRQTQWLEKEGQRKKAQNIASSTQ